MIRGTLIAVSLVAVFASACEHKGDVAKLPEAPAKTPGAEAPAKAPGTVAAPGQVAPAAPAAEAATVAGAPEGASATNTPFLSGTTEAHRRSTLTPKVSSVITRVHVRDGDLVRAGQPLVTLDTEDFSLRTKQAEAALEAARVGMDAAKLDHDRMKALVADKAIPQSQFDMVDARYKGAKAQVEQAEVAVAMGRKALRDAVVHAPFSGLVVKRYVNEGEYATVMPATSLVTLEELNPIDIRISVPSADMNKVHAGDGIHVRLPALGRELDARITRIVQANDPKTRSFSAIAEVANEDHSLRSGLYAEVTLTGGAKVAEAKPVTSKRRAARAPRVEQ